MQFVPRNFKVNLSGAIPWLGASRTDANERLKQEFTKHGVVVLMPEERVERWLARARRRADSESQSASCTARFEGTWVQCFEFRMPLPPHRRLKRLLRRLFPYYPQSCDIAHLSSVAYGYPASAVENRKTLGRHIDGTRSRRELWKWFGAIVGVLLQDLPEEGCGNPVFWPGSHMHTRTALAAIAESPTEQNIAEVIWKQSQRQLDIEPVQLTGKAGTVVVMDHALHHGIAPNDNGTLRHVVYYRLPWRGTTEPQAIVDPNYFAGPPRNYS